MHELEYELNSVGLVLRSVISFQGIIHCCYVFGVLIFVLVCLFVFIVCSDCFLLLNHEYKLHTFQSN
jgi:hypothetical protein